MYFVDFDDTLFDTQSYKKALCESVKEFGVNDELFWNTYKNSRVNEYGEFVYTAERHAQILAREGFSEQEILSALKGVSKSIGKFLFAESREFLEKLKGTGRKLILLSLGESTFQHHKVEGCNISEYFLAMEMVKKDKGDIIEKYWDGKGIITLINDKIQESIILKERFPSLKIVLKKSPLFSEEEYKNSGLDFGNNLLEMVAEFNLLENNT